MSAGRAPSTAEVAGLAGMLRRTGRTVECTIDGESMAPALRAGTAVRIRCDGGAVAAEGALVALLLGGTLTVHRLVHRGRSARARGWVVTDGDANRFCDAPVRDTLVVGEVEEVRDAAGVWRAPGPRTRARRAVFIAADWAICRGLELHPRVGRAIKGLTVLATVPLVWLRPYPASAVRSASIAHREP